MRFRRVDATTERIVEAFREAICVRIPQEFNEWWTASKEVSQAVGKQFREFFPGRVAHWVYDFGGKPKESEVQGFKIKKGSCKHEGEQCVIFVVVERKDCTKMPKQEAEKKMREFEEYCDTIARAINETIHERD